jgi:hypothetical protein
MCEGRLEISLAKWLKSDLKTMKIDGKHFPAQ